MSHFPFSIFNFTFERASTRIRLDVADDSFTRECVKTVYMSCPVLGRGTLRATWTPDEGSDLSDEAGYQVIEPIRKLVTTERFNGMGPILNPLYGVGDDSRGDISDGSVRSLRVVDVINSNSVYRAQVGVRYFKKTDEEVYANEK